MIKDKLIIGVIGICDTVILAEHLAKIKQPTEILNRGILINKQESIVFKMTSTDYVNYFTPRPPKSHIRPYKYHS